MVILLIMFSEIQKKTIKYAADRNNIFKMSKMLFKTCISITELNYGGKCHTWSYTIDPNTLKVYKCQHNSTESL